MEQLFCRMTELAVSGSLAILGILLFRWILRNQEKIFSYILWAIAGLRLLVPISFGGVWSFLFSAWGEQQSGGSTGLSFMRNLTGTAGDVRGKYVSPSGSAWDILPAETSWMQWLLLMWLVGTAVFFGKNIFAYICLRKKVRDCIRKNDYCVLDNICGGFVLGVLKPRIYVSGYLTEEEREYVLAHERIHLRRRDDIWKLLAECILCVYWWNPLVWLAFQLFTEDMEMSCDEAVLRRKSRNARAGYARTLLAEAVRSQKQEMVPFFMGERTERRICNLMREKKLDKKKIGVCAGVLLAAAVLLVPGFWEQKASGKAQESILRQEKESGKGKEKAVSGEEGKPSKPEQISEGKPTEDSVDVELKPGEPDSREREYKEKLTEQPGREIGFPTNMYEFHEPNLAELPDSEAGAEK